MTTQRPTLDVALAERALNRIPGVVQIYRMDLATGATDWVFLNHACETVYGVPYEKVLAEGPGSLGPLIHPDDMEAINAAFLQGVTTLEDTHYTMRMVRPDGSTIHMEVSSTYEREESTGKVLIYSHSRDMAQQVEMQASLDRSRRELEEREALYRAVVDALPVGVGVIDLNGAFEVTNATLRRMFPLPEEKLSELRFEEQGNLVSVLRLDGTEFPPAEQSVGRVLAGSESAHDEILVSIAGQAKSTRVESSAFAMRNAEGKLHHVLSVTHDVTAQRALEDEIQTRNAQLAESEADKTQLIERLRHAVDELSNPILEVWDDVLLLPVIGLVDSRRAADMVARLLDAVAHGQARYVIIDLTGVEIVDTRTADHLIKLVKKVELVGARCVLTGIRPAVAQTLVDIGVDFGRLTTLRNLKHGLRDALVSTRREREGQELADRDFEGRR